MNGKFMTTAKSIALNFAKKKETLDMNDIALAKATGLSLKTIEKVMHGEKSYRVSSLLAIADALDLEVFLLEKMVVKEVLFDPMLHPRAVQGVIDKLKDL